MKCTSVILISSFIAIISIFLEVSAETSTKNDRLKAYLDKEIFSVEEIDWLRSHERLKLAIVKDHYPFEFVNQFGEYSGLTSDYIKIITDKIGISATVEYTTNDFSELSELLLSEKIDVLTYMPIGDETEKLFSFSDPIIKMPVVILGHTDTPIVPNITALEGEVVLVQRGSYAHEFMTRDYPKISLRYVQDASEGLLLLDSKKGKYFLHNFFSSEHYKQILGIQSVKILNTTDYTYDIAFCVNNKNKIFISILHKMINEITPLERRLVFDKWINVKIEKLVDWVWIVRFVGFTFFAVVFLITFFVYWNRKLSSKVRERTAELQSSSQKLRQLTKHMNEVREEEKSKLAREIHDELGHTLTALSMSLRRLKGIGMEAEIEHLKILVKDASNTSKKIMSDLRPSILEDFGLAAALEWLLDEYKQNSGIDTLLTAEPLSFSLRDEAATALFRIVQEALTNIAKHASATSVDIRLFEQSESLVLDIHDNGVGLELGWASKEGSFGLQGMEERANSFDGELNIHTEPNVGVVISVVFPQSSVFQTPI